MIGRRMHWCTSLAAMAAIALLAAPDCEARRGSAGSQVAGHPVARPGSISHLFRRVSPSVVDIITVGSDITIAGPERPVSVGGIGSGVLVSKDGKVLTAAHVVQTAEAVKVRFIGGQVVDARVLGTEPAADLALLQVDHVPSDAVTVPLGDSDLVEVGDQVFVVGAPFGASHTLTVGYVSARRKPDKVVAGFEACEILQTDAAVNPGNSGGPLFNMAGEVVGIASFIISESGGFQGLGFAVTSNMAKKLLLEGRPMWSGMEGEILEGKLARILNIPQEGGILITRVAKNSPAALLGLRPGHLRVQLPGDQEIILGGDVVLEVQGIAANDIESYVRIRQALRQIAPTDTLRVKVLRGGEVVLLEKELRTITER